MRAQPPVDPLRPDQLALARRDHERAAHLRTDESALVALWGDPTTRVMRLHRGRVGVDGAAIRWARPAEIVGGERFFLGLHESTAYFAAAVAEEADLGDSATLRELGAALAPLEVGLVVQAVALAQWHATHTHCARCGAQTHVRHAGYVRRCGECEAEHYPRTDPAVIVLVVDDEDRILLGRQAVWPVGRFSTFAGFVEPGESFEAAVMREVEEEAGVPVDQVQYIGSQPWPFPASVMIAFTAITHHPHGARPDGMEIEEVRWFTREELTEAITSGTVILPPSVSIARRMIEGWFGAALHGGEAWR